MQIKPSLRIVPLSVGFLLKVLETNEYRTAFEEFPAYSSVLLKLATNLRTVIVTAAVHWGFNSALARLLLTFQHRAGVTPYTSPTRVCREL
jgi:hypothetical protein